MFLLTAGCNISASITDDTEGPGHIRHNDMRYFSSISISLVLLVLTIACSNNSNSPFIGDDSQEYYLYTTPGSDLVLYVPDMYNLTIGEVSEIHGSAEQMPYCYDTSGVPVHIVLAEACVYYH